MENTSSRDLLVRLLDEGYNQEAWYGPGLLTPLKRMKAAEAAWRPAPGSRNIWEIALHAAYWKYVVWRKLTGAKRGSFPRKGSNWFERPTAGLSETEMRQEWKNELGVLEAMHRQLRDLVLRLSPEELRRPLGNGMTVQEFVANAAAHDVYHAGQIQTLCQLRREMNASNAAVGAP